MHVEVWENPKLPKRDKKTGRFLPGTGGSGKSNPSKKKGRAAASNPPPKTVTKKAPNHLLPVGQVMGGAALGGGLTFALQKALTAMGDATTGDAKGVATTLEPHSGLLIAGGFGLAAWMLKARIAAVWQRMLLGIAAGGVATWAMRWLTTSAVVKDVEAAVTQALAQGAAAGELSPEQLAADVGQTADEAAQAAQGGIQGLRGRRAQAGLGRRVPVRQLDQMMGNGIRLAGLELVPASRAPRSPAVNPAMGSLSTTTAARMRAGGTRLGSLSTVGNGWPSEYSYTPRQAWPGRR